MKLLVSIFAGVSIILTLVCLSLVYKNSTLEKGIRTRISRKYKNGPGSKNSDPMDFFSDMDLGDEDEDTNSALTSGDEDEAPNWITNELSPPGSSKTVSGRGSANSKDENTWEVTVHGASGATVYLSTIIFRINKASPRVGGKVHFDGMARLASGQQVPSRRAAGGQALGRRSLTGSCGGILRSPSHLGRRPVLLRDAEPLAVGLQTAPHHATGD